MDNQPPAPGRALDLSLTLLLAPIVTRIALLIDGAGTPAASDVTGFLSDVGVAEILAAALWLALARLRRGRRLLGGVVALLWAALHHANYEHTRELGAGLQLTYAHYLGDATFLLGSALSVTAPGLLTGLLVGSLAAMAYALRPGVAPHAGAVTTRREGVTSDRSAPLMAIGVLCLAVAHTMPQEGQGLAWRRGHFLPLLVSDELSASRRQGARLQLHRPPVGLRADLSGAPRFDLPGSGSNVLVVMLEGLPATVLPSLAEPGVETDYLMPRLGEWAARGLSAENFVLHQRQTNRGVYALLCGDYPKLDRSVAKMSLYAEAPARNCLPRVLGAAGFRTLYLQGAPLAYMYKDRFATSAGFDVVSGDSDFPAPRHRTPWGVDDRSLFDRALGLIEQSREQGAPFFLTILSVGTHHPNVVPASFEAASGLRGFPAAASYLDSALDDFLRTLAERGVFDDTLVILTSDESRGGHASSELHDVFSRNWGPLVVLAPEGARGVIEAPFGLSDVAVSILDYLGLDARGTGFIGRSLFRAYDEPRRVFFANAYLRKLGWVDGAGVAALCDEGGVECHKYVAPRHRLFRPEGPEQPLEVSEEKALQVTLEYSLSNVVGLGSRFSLRLLGIDSVPLRPGGEQRLMDGQGIELPAFSRGEVTIAARLDAPGRQARLHHLLKQGTGRDRIDLPLGTLADGDAIEIRYALESAENPLEDLRFRLSSVLVGAAGGGPAWLRMGDATLRVTPLDEPRGRVGLVEGPVVALRPAAERHRD